MKLVYHRSGVGNFGDDLNEWIWKELLGEDFFDDDEGVLFYGIGTILSRSMPQRCTKILFGSGAGRESYPPLDGTYDVRCVRGPLTARALRLPPEAAITDPACLILRTAFGRQQAAKEFEVALIPHNRSLGTLDWDSVSSEVGMRLIDPRRPYLRVMEEIRRSKLVVTESLHGAIIADAFRVPWIAFRFGYRFREFKWRDWAGSMEVDLAVHELPFVFQGTLTYSTVIKNLLRRSLAGLLKKQSWRRRPYRRSTREDMAELTRALSRIPLEATPSLSADAKLQDVLDRLEQKLESLRSDYA